MKNLINIYKEYSQLPLQQVIDYDRYNQLMLIHSSSVMEGSTLTLGESEILITEGITPQGKPLVHSLMIKDHYQALEYVLEQAKNPSVQLNEQLIQGIGARVMHSTGGELNTALGAVDSRAGDYRNSASRATGGSYYVAPNKVPEMMKDLCKNLTESMDKISSFEDTLALSCYAHLQLLTIHPFVGGNGRSARLLQNFIVAKKGMPLVVLRHEQKQEYIEAIKKSRSMNDMKYFEAFISSEHSFHLQNEISQFNKMKKGQNKGMSFILSLGL